MLKYAKLELKAHLTNLLKQYDRKLQNEFFYYFQSKYFEDMSSFILKYPQYLKMIMVRYNNFCIKSAVLGAKSTDKNNKNGLLSKGNNPMVGATVACAVAVEESNK